MSGSRSPRRPRCGWCRCRRASSPSPDQVDPFYEALSRQRVEVAPIHFDGTGYLRIAAAPYNTLDDYDRLAGAVRELLQRSGSDRVGR